MLSLAGAMSLQGFLLYSLWEEALELDAWVFLRRPFLFVFFFFPPSVSKLWILLTCFCSCFSVKILEFFVIRRTFQGVFLGKIPAEPRM